MERTPLHGLLGAATSIALAALLWVQPAFAHVDVRPRLVEQGAAATLRVELPQLRAGPAPVRLEVEGEGVTVLTSSLEGANGPETLWSVRLRIGQAVPPGDLLLVLRAVFADGESVEVDGGVVVVPPEVASETFPWGVAAAGVSLAVLLGAAGLLLARRRT